MKEAVELFGCNVQSCGDRGETALHVAAELGDLEIIEYLLAKGANPNARTHKIKCSESEYQTPLITAIQHGQLNVVKYFNSKGFIEEQPAFKLHAQCLLVGIRNCHVEIVNYLCCEVGVSPNSIDYESCLIGRLRPPVTQAIRRDLVETVKLFHSLGADMNILSGDGDDFPCAPPLIWALQMGSIDSLKIIKFLVEEVKVNLDLCDKKGFNPCCYAVHSNSDGSHLKLLIDAGANIFAGTGSVLASVIRYHNSVWIDLLLQMGANPLGPLCGAKLQSEIDSKLRKRKE